MSKKAEVGLDKILEALLFVHGEEIGLQKLAKLVGENNLSVKAALASLKDRLEKQSGLRLLEKDERVQLVTAPDYAPLVAKLFREEHREDLSRASLEVLAIVAYEGPVGRTEIETIRGVNSSYIIRNLVLRGLIEDKGRGRERQPQYDLSFEAARRLGLERKENLPHWNEIQKEITQAKEALARIDKFRTNEGDA